MRLKLSWRLRLLWALPLLALGMALVGPARGAGPLIVATAGAPPAVFAWSTAAEVPFHCDLGTLGVLTNAQARVLVTSLFQILEDAPTANIGFVEGTQLSADVVPGNYASFSGVNDGLNPIIFDTDGSIHDAILGAGQSNFVLGFAGPEFVSGSTIVGAKAVLNGKFIDGISTAGNPEITQNQFRGVFVHEFGHFINLDHTQINRVQHTDGIGANDEEVPTMYPFIFGASTQQETLHRDDHTSVSTIYPEATFTTTLGTIEGTVFAQDGVTSFQGMNVIARKVDDAQITAASCVSGFLFRSSDNSSGTLDTAFRGFYRIGGLPPGSYTVEIETVDTRFTGGSSVGPVDPARDGSGFEYWNGFNEGANPALDVPSQQVVIPVTAGVTTSAINFTLNHSYGLHQTFPVSSTLTDLDNTQLIFTPSSTAPGGYTVRRITGVVVFPVTGGGNVTLGDDDFASFSLGGSFVTAFGVPYHQFNLSSNGFMTFGNAPANPANTDGTEFDHTPRPEDHYGPRAHLSGLFTDLVPAGAPANTVQVGFSTTIGLVATFNSVPVFGGGTASFQILVEPDGDVIYTYLGVQASTSAGGALVGVSSAGTFNAAAVTSISTSQLANDVTDPVVNITSPAAGATVTGVIAFTATFADAGTSSGQRDLRFFIDGRQQGTAQAGTPGTVNVDTNLLTNGQKRLEVFGYDRSGRVGRASIVVHVNNTNKLRLGHTISGSSVSQPFVTFTLTIQNASAVTADNLTLQSMWLEGTGAAIPGVVRIYVNPTSGAPLPRNLGTLTAGQSVAIQMRGFIPAGVTSINRWVNTGTATVAGSPVTF